MRPALELAARVLLPRHLADYAIQQISVKNPYSPRDLSYQRFLLDAAWSMWWRNQYAILLAHHERGCMVHDV